MVPVNFIRTDKITVYIPCLELGVVFLLFFFFFLHFPIVCFPCAGLYSCYCATMERFGSDFFYFYSTGHLST